MTQYENCLNRLLQLLAERRSGAAAVDADSELVADLNLSSIDVMELIEEVEDEFDVSFPLNALPDIRTVGELAAALTRLLQQ